MRNLLDVISTERVILYKRVRAPHKVFRVLRDAEYTYMYICLLVCDTEDKKHVQFFNAKNTPVSKVIFIPLMVHSMSTHVNLVYENVRKAPLLHSFLIGILANHYSALSNRELIARAYQMHASEQ